MEQSAYTPEEDINNPWSRTAIERQLAAAAALGYGSKPQEGAPRVPPDGRFVPAYSTELNKLNRFGFWSFLILCLLVVVGVGLIFNYSGGPLQKTISQRAETFMRDHNVLAPANNSAAPINSSPANNSSTTNNSAPATSSPQTNSPSQANSSQINNSSEVGGSQAVNAQSVNNSVAANSAVNNAAATNTSVNTNSSAADSSAANASSANAALIASVRENATQTTVAQISAPQTQEQKAIAEVPTSPALSIPISDVSLRNRPELLEQLVQIYKTQFAKDPSNATALAALTQLQDQSLSELQIIIAQGDPAATVKAVATIARIFPELADNTRYKYLIARMDYNQRSVKDEPIIKAEASVPSANVKPVAAAPAVIAPSPASPVVKSAEVKSVTTPSAQPIKEASSNVAASSATKNTESAVSSKPEIRSVSIVPGALVDDHFVPRDGGNVFMVEINYRNFEKVFEGHPAATLTTLLGTPDDSLVLAEVPIIITADRGTKSFLMETQAAQGYAGGKFELNFMVNDEFLTSRSIRLSRPGR